MKVIPISLLLVGLLGLTAIHPQRVQTKNEARVESVRRVVDGDTYDLRLDLGFDILLDARIRLLGIDTPEMRGGTEETRAAAQHAAELAEAWLRSPGELTVSATKKDSFGRWLAQIRRNNDSLTVYLLQKKAGVPR